MDFDFFNLSTAQITSCKTLFITVSIMLIYFGFNRAFTQFRTERCLTAELAINDNFAYGLSYAGSILAFGLIASEVLHGLSFDDPIADSFHAVVYAGLAVGFLELGRYCHDRFILAAFDENSAINQKNITGAVIDASSMIANALCIMGVFHWSGANTIDDLPIISVMFLLCQLQLLALTRWREYRFSLGNQGASMQRTFGHQNLALSIQHGGYLIAGALAMKTATQINPYHPAQLTTNVSQFVVASAAVVVVTIILSAIGSKIVLANINSDVEIDHQDNVGIATVEFALLIAFSLVLHKSFSLA